MTNAPHQFVPRCSDVSMSTVGPSDLCSSPLLLRRAGAGAPGAPRGTRAFLALDQRCCITGNCRWFLRRKGLLRADEIVGAAPAALPITPCRSGRSGAVQYLGWHDGQEHGRAGGPRRPGQPAVLGDRQPCPEPAQGTGAGRGAAGGAVRHLQGHALEDRERPDLAQPVHHRAAGRGPGHAGDVAVPRAGRGARRGLRQGGQRPGDRPAGHPGRPRYQLLGSLRGPYKRAEPLLVSLTEPTEVFPIFQHPGVEILYMLDGKLEYSCGTQNYLMEPGTPCSSRATSRTGRRS